MEASMNLTRRSLLGAAALVGVAPLPPRRARAGASTIKSGVLNDQAGVYRDVSGPTSVACAQQAVEDFGAGAKGLDVQVVFADHQNKPDIGVNICREWFDRDGVDLVIDVPNSAVALAVAGIAKEKDRAYICSTAATADLTGPACAPTTIHWTYDTWMLAHSTGGAMVKAGGDAWFFITADYAFGHALQRDTANFVNAAGGKVLGSVDHPFPGTTDFSSFLLAAQASGAKVIGLCNAGGDTVNSIKQAAEFGITAGGQKLAGLLMFINDIHALGLATAQGLVLSESFYWDLNDRTRAMTKRVLQRTKDQYPAMSHAGVYSGTFHYLKAVADVGAAEAKRSGAATVARMKKMPTDDDAFGPGRIREDGRALHPAYLFEVKKPSESKYPWDYYKLIATTPAEQAFRPLRDGACPMIKA
jgi:branched-chain amino acid transport system substrate-binding protein